MAVVGNGPFDEETAGRLVLQLLPRLASKSNGPAILAIAGPSGVGKSTCAAHLCKLLSGQGKQTKVLGMDDFFHSASHRATLDEWSPSHVRLDDLQRVLRSLSAGTPQPQVQRYVRKPHAHMQSWTPDLAGADIVIFEGLYTLSTAKECGQLGAFADCGLFLDASAELLKSWRFQQEAAKPAGRSLAGMEQHWCEGIVPDSGLRVLPSKKNAHFLLQKDAQHRITVSPNPKLC